MEDFHNPELQQHARGRATGRRVRMRGGLDRGRGGNRRVRVSDEIMDHVINHGFTTEEAGRRVQPNVNRSTVSSIVQTFHRETCRYVFMFLFYSM